MSNQSNPPPRPPRPPRPRSTHNPGPSQPSRPQNTDRFSGQPAQQQYGQPLSSAPTQKSNSLALFSLIVGILSALSGMLSICVPCLCAIPVLLGIAGGVLGFLAKKQVDDSGGPDASRKMAVAGMILGIAGLGFSVIATIISIISPPGIGPLGIPMRNLIEGF